MCTYRSVLLVFAASMVFALNVSVIAQPKSSIPDSTEILHNPRKAALLSAVLPGAGQIYNHKYWKPPIIYIGAGTLLYFANYNNIRYNRYKDAFKLRYDNDSTTIDEFNGIYQDQDLITLKNYFRRNRDLLYICTGLLYTLNILDAYVDAHLFYFTVNDDALVYYRPYIDAGRNNTHLGITLTMQLK